MLSLLGFISLKAELVCTTVLSVVLAILLIYEHWQKKLMEKAKDFKEPDTEHENIYRG